VLHRIVLALAIPLFACCQQLPPGMEWADPAKNQAAKAQTARRSAPVGRPPVPSKWEGEASGVVYGREFRLPVFIELSAPIEYENNPFHLYFGTGEIESVGDVLLVSAASFSSAGFGPTAVWGGRVGVYYKRATPHSARPIVRQQGATLRYLTITMADARVKATLTDTNAAAAAVINGFTGPNVSAKEASDVMRGVMESFGPTEIFLFNQGAVLTLKFEGSAVSGEFEGQGRSATNTSSDVTYRCKFRAKRVE